MRSLALILLLLPAVSLADSSFRLPVYLGVSVDRQSLPIDGRKFRPLLATASVGVWWLDGIGTELEFGTGLVEDNVDSLDFETTSILGINLRLEARPVNRVSAYAIFGYSRASYETRFSFESSAQRSDFAGFHGGLGLVIPVSQRLMVDASFNRHEFDADLGVNTFRIGFRYALNDVQPSQRPGWLR